MRTQMITGAAACALVLCWGLAAALPAQAQQALSLSACQREARARAPEAHAVQARLRGAQRIAEDAERVLRSDPELSLRYDTDLERDGGHMLSAGLALKLDIAGSFGPRAAAGAAERAQAAHEGKDALLALDEAVAIAVAELALAQRQHERAGRVTALQEIVANAARRQLELGQGNQLEDDGAQLDVAAARADLARANSERERSAAQLARLLGRTDARNLSVEDPAEQADVVPDAAAPPIDTAPAVQAASSAQQAAREQLALQDRLVWATPTLGVELGRERARIPRGAFADAALTAHWDEWRFGIMLEFPLPILDRNQEQRAQAQARLLTAGAELELARADAHAARITSAAELRAASDAYRALESTALVLERSYRLLEQATRAGALDAVARVQALQRLNESGKHLDTAIRDLRVARARFIRRTAR